MSPMKLDQRIIADLERFLRDELTRIQGSLRAVVTESRTTESTSLTDMSVHAAETLHTEIQVALMDRRTQQVDADPGRPRAAVRWPVRILPGVRGVHRGTAAPRACPSPSVAATARGKRSGEPVATRCLPARRRARSRSRRPDGKAPRRPTPRPVKTGRGVGTVGGCAVPALPWPAIPCSSAGSTGLQIREPDSIRGGVYASASARSGSHSAPPRRAGAVTQLGPIVQLDPPPARLRPMALTAANPIARRRGRCLFHSRTHVRLESAPSDAASHCPGRDTVSGPIVEIDRPVCIHPLFHGCHRIGTALAPSEGDRNP